MDSGQLLSLQAKRKEKPTDEDVKTEKNSMKLSHKEGIMRVFKSLQGACNNCIKKPPTQCDGSEAICEIEKSEIFIG